MKKSKVFKVYLIYFISMAIFCCMRIASALGAFNFLHKDIADLLYTCIIQIGLMFMLPLALYTLIVHDKVGFVGTFKTAQLDHKVNFKVILL